MKQKCIQCDKVYYPTNNNFVGYPQTWGVALDCNNRIFCTRGCMEYFIKNHEDIIIPIFKQIKESEAINARIRENKA